MGKPTTKSSSGDDKVADLLLLDEIPPENSAIIDREQAAHEAFANSRSKDFVYILSKDYYRVLDDFCKPDIPGPKMPLIVVGSPCSGKTALLANWVKKCRQADPNVFICEHYAGASSDSVKLSFFLYRLMHRLKSMFSLKDFELPNQYEEERLKFSLARCFSAAARARGGASKSMNKVASLIIVIDGVDNLRTENGGDSLTWLPKNIPEGIFIIASATQTPTSAQLLSCQYISRIKYNYDSDDELLLPDTPEHDKHDTHITEEFRRRKCCFLLVEPLDEQTCGAIIETFAKQHSDLSNVDTKAILNAHGSSNPLFVRLVLETLAIPALQTKADVLTTMLKTRDIATLYQVIMGYWNDILQARIVAEAKAGTSSGSCPSTTTRKSRKAVQIDLSGPAKQQYSLIPRHLLSLLAVTQCGLTESDLYHLLEDSVPKVAIETILEILQPHLLKICRTDCPSNPVFYDISHNPLRLIVRCHFLADDALRLNYRKEIARYMTSIPACQRKLDELPIQLRHCGMWTQLQSTLVDIRMFKLWWTDKNRQDFMAYWRIFRSHCSGSDPVDEYIRSLHEYMGGDMSNVEVLLSLLTEITSFFRSWQSHDDREQKKPNFHRPPAPELRDLYTCHGPFTVSDSDSPDVKKILSNLSPLPTDSYYVKRWLWAQFPIIALAFEDYFLRPVFQKQHATEVPKASSSTKIPQVQSKDKDQKHAPAEDATKQGVSLPSPFLRAESSISSGGIKSSRRMSTRPKPLATSQSTPALHEGNTSSFEFLSSDKGDSKISAAKLTEQIRLLRADYDKLVYTAQEKEKFIQQLDSKIADSEADASQRNNDAKKSTDMQQRMLWATKVAAEGKMRSQYYRLILRQCELKPAKDPKMIEDAELSVRQMKQDIVDLQQKAQVISYERKLASIEIPKLQAAIENQSAVHNQALDRLRWRHVQSVRQHDWELKFRIRSREMKRQATGDLGVEAESQMLNLMQQKVTIRNAASKEKRMTMSGLQKYQGSPFRDDGLLGVLREAGVNQPKDVIMRWEDMQVQQKQLTSEKAYCENKLVHLRTQLEATQNELQQLKLGYEPQPNTEASSPSEQLPPQHTQQVPSDPDLATPGATGMSKTNMKQLEANLKAATRVNELKKQKVTRLRNLGEKIRLGLLHIERLVGSEHALSQHVTTRKSLDLLDSVERGIRQLIGEESHNQNSNPNLRRKPSSKILKLETKSPSEKLLYNVRVQPGLFKAGKDDNELEEDEDDVDEGDVDAISTTRLQIKALTRTELEKRKVPRSSKDEATAGMTGTGS